MTTLEQKKQLLSLAEAHEAADEFRQGDTQLCSVGCSVSDAMRLNIVPDGDPYSHDTIAKLWGVPIQIAYLFDTIFEGLPSELARKWTPRWQRAILGNDGKDVSNSHHVFCHWLLAESGLLTITAENRKAIEDVANLHSRAASGDQVAESEWSAAESAVWSAAESAVWSAAAWSARAAAWSAARSARSAAWSAAAAYETMADKLIAILSEGT